MEDHTPTWNNWNGNLGSITYSFNIPNTAVVTSKKHIYTKSRNYQLEVSTKIIFVHITPKI